MSWKFTEVTEPVVVLCEGRDEQVLLQTLAAASHVQVQCVDCGGSQQFATRIKVVMKAPGFAQVRALAIVRDAETDSAAAAQSIRACLQNEGLPVPEAELQLASDATISTAYLVVPRGGADGMMEDLILRVMQDQPHWPCQTGYFDCLASKGLDLSIDEKKRWVQAGLAALTGGHLARNIGEAAQKSLLPLDHPAFDELRNLLRLVVGN